MRNIKSKDGFTLIELLAVIAILAILLIIAIPSVIKMYNNAKINTFVDEVQSVINTAEKQYMSDQINSNTPTCYSNEEGNDCPDLELSGNKNLKYYIGFDGGHIIEANVTDGTHTWDSGNLEKVEASSVKASDVDSENANRENTPSIPDPVSFDTDSWATIQKAVQSGSYPYEVGNTKTITLAAHTNDCASFTGSGATYACVSKDEPAKEVTIRVSNTSACTNGETSETACGFVVEFVDIIENHNMNSADATNTNGTNVGGWRDSEMRTYVNGTLFNALPEELRNVISETTVVSGHGSGDSNSERADGNWETTDKLYLLSAQEIYGTSFTGTTDTSNGTSRQLDYYAQNNVTTSNYSLAIKQYGVSNVKWWLRSARSLSANNFLNIDGKGICSNYSARITSGLFAAFRIGE